MFYYTESLKDLTSMNKPNATLTWHMDLISFRQTLAFFSQAS